MPNFNRVIVMGNLTHDPILEEKNQSHICTFTIAINRKVKGSDILQDEVTYVKCYCWGGRGKAIHEFFTKGKPIFIEGHLKMVPWQNAHGEESKILKILVTAFEFVDSKEELA